MKVFLSWSGSPSKEIATILHDWLPTVIQSVETYMSSENIQKGSAWFAQISGALEEHNFGIICLTKNNLDAPWLLFEAGALAKFFGESRVCPFLFELNASDVQGPLSQFQWTLYQQADFLKLVQTINSNLEPELGEAILKKSFDKFWPDLKSQLDPLKGQSGMPSATPETSEKGRNSDKILEEILTLLRNQQRLLQSPEELLPRQYLTEILESRSPWSNVPLTEKLAAANWLLKSVPVTTSSSWADYIPSSSPEEPGAARLLLSPEVKKALSELLKNPYAIKEPEKPKR